MLILKLKHPLILLCGMLSLVKTSSAEIQTRFTETEWQKIEHPISGIPSPIGSYTNGCLIGAKALPLEGAGYQIIRWQKKRYFGHPTMITYLENLGKRSQKAGLPPILISDIAMPAGGRFATGHASHQIGLDADIWLRFGPLPKEQTQNPTATLMVNRKLQIVEHTLWSQQHTLLLKLAATDPSVARIFINPAIKKKLCETVKEDRGWLHKIRPWFGHDAHFHVRLHCPKDAPYCEEQASIPEGDGCDATLDSWFLPTPLNKKLAPKKSAPPPPLCQQVLDSLNKKE
ncbi:penicillin-insensitive murein endopeptidase [Mergibacter septicus]|nr:penicillin-insensitive murein endopeptidase [Mergibacter septicus]AWX13244.1 penicillin-insensitive murein endopeptidase [Mergibacter septicus]